MIRQKEKAIKQRKIMLVQIQDLKVGDTVSSPHFIRAIKQGQYNGELGINEFCPTRPKMVVTPGDLTGVPLKQQAVDLSRENKIYEVRRVFVKDKFCILKHPETKERLNLKFGLPAVELHSRLSEEEYKKKIDKIAIRDEKRRENKKKSPPLKRDRYSIGTLQYQPYPGTPGPQEMPDFDELA
jgi:hypothetical protein